MKKTIRILCLIGLLLLPLTASAANYATFYRFGDREENRVAITIDDWYEPALLTDFMAVADEYGVKLTCYPCGFNLHEEDRALWQAYLDAGHEIGSHGYVHMRYTERGAAQIARDYQKFEAALDKTLGYHYEFLTVRVPYGAGLGQGGSGKVGRSVHAAGFDNVVFWDYDKTNNVPEALKKIKNGSVVLMHANRHDLKYFKNLMEGLKDRGYEYVTVSELFHLTTRLNESAS